MNYENEDRSCEIRRSYGQVEKIDFRDSFYLKGCVVTPDGIVQVYSQQDENPYTFLSFALCGRMYSRTFKRFYSARFLTTLATRFIEEIVEEVTDAA